MIYNVHKYFASLYGMHTLILHKLGMIYRIRNLTSEYIIILIQSKINKAHILILSTIRKEKFIPTSIHKINLSKEW